MSIEKFEQSDYYENLLIAISEEPDDFSQIEKRFHCKIDFNKEKHNALQYTYYFEIWSPLMKETMFVEIESGINNGTKINQVSFYENLTPKTRTVEVLKDIVLDSEYYEKDSFLEKKAQAVLNANKSKLFEFNRQNNYDNYVTGGNSKMKMNDLLSKLHLEYIYEEKEVNVNFV